MFVAKFQQTSGDAFKTDKNGEHPFIGTVMAGSAKGTLINGTMFKRDGLEPNVLYCCDNEIDPNFPEHQQVIVISKVSITEFMELRTQLGAGKLVREAVEAPVAEEIA